MRPRRGRAREWLGAALVLALSLSAAGCRHAGEAGAPAAAASVPASQPASTPSIRSGTRSAAQAPAPGGDAVDSVRALYDLHMRLQASGIPMGEELARYRPFLSRRLLARMDVAGRERDRVIAEEPELKPPYIEGDLFSGLTEGASGYTLGPHRALGPDRERVDLEFVYRDLTSVVRWRCRALMLREDGLWKLDELEYGSFDAGVTGEFVHSGSLTQSLQEP